MSTELSREIANKFTKICKLDNSLILKNTPSRPIAVIAPGYGIIEFEINECTKNYALKHLMKIFEIINDYKAILSELRYVYTDRYTIRLEYSGIDADFEHNELEIDINDGLWSKAMLDMHFDKNLYTFARTLLLRQYDHIHYKPVNIIRYSYVKCNNTRYITCADISTNNYNVIPLAEKLNKNLFNVLKDQSYYSCMIADSQDYYEISIEISHLELNFMVPHVDENVLNLIFEVVKQMRKLSKTYYLTKDFYQLNFEINNDQIIFKFISWRIPKLKLKILFDVKHLTDAFGNFIALLVTGEKKLINLIKDKIDNYDTFVDILTDFYTNLLLNNDVHIMSLPRNLPFYINNAINQTLVNYSF